MSERSEVNPYQAPERKMEKTINKGQRQYKILERTILIHEQPQPHHQLSQFQRSIAEQVLEIHHHEQMVPDPDRPSITIYNKPKDPWWNVFPCCKQVQIERDFQDCDICRRRIFNSKPLELQEQPYVSRHRMKARQKQPINVFYDRICNNQLVKDSWKV